MKKAAKKAAKKWLPALLAALFVLLLAVFACFAPYRKWLPAYRLPARAEGMLRLHFLDVGQGDCTIVEFPEGRLLVIDAGDGSFVHENKLVRYIKGLHPTAVDLIATHADLDHYGGLEELIGIFSVGAVYLPALGSGEREYAELLSAVRRAGCEERTLSRYATIESESGAYCVCLNPYSQGETDGNDASAVLYFDYGGVRALLAGDISAARERRLVREYALDGGLFDSKGHSVRLDGIDILRLAHHGSDSSSSEEWLDLLRPAAAIVSCGRGNRYGHPAGGVFERLRKAACDCEVFRTDERGDIVVSIVGGEYTVTSGGNR